MLDSLLGVIEYLNRGDELEAAKKLIEVATYAEDEVLMKIVGEIEKEIHEINSPYLGDGLAGDLVHELRLVEEEIRDLRKRKLRILITSAIDRLSNGNSILLQMLRRPSLVRRPQTFM